jgi:hypothetical protein
VDEFKLEGVQAGGHGRSGGEIFHDMCGGSKVGIVEAADTGILGTF